VLSNSKTNSIGETLTERPCGNFNALGVMCFGMTRSDAIYRLERWKVRIRDLCDNFDRRLTRKALISSMEILYPQRWRRAYWSMQPCPLLFVVSTVAMVKISLNVNCKPVKRAAKRHFARETCRMKESGPLQPPFQPNYDARMKKSVRQSSSGSCCLKLAILQNSSIQQGKDEVLTRERICRG
jgi:hypothetical protein